MYGTFVEQPADIASRTTASFESGDDIRRAADHLSYVALDIGVAGSASPVVDCRKYIARSDSSWIRYD
jgi:hypothetical protein